MSIKLRKFWPLFLSYIVLSIFVLINSENPFFWDTVQLGSHHANHYFSSNFSKLLLPDHIDSGHIPAFGMYIALAWKLFGRSLIISHLAMLPIVFGILLQVFSLIQRFVPVKYLGIAFLLILIDPTLLSQVILVSPDIPLVFFFLLGVNAILDNKKIILMTAVVFLFLSSMRGMMVSVCLLILDLYLNASFYRNIKKMMLMLLKRSLIYLPAFFIFIFYSFLHYSEKGWIGFHADSPWAESFRQVGLKGFVFNVGVLGWRLLDFGRVVVWVVLLVLFATYKKEILKDKKVHVLIFFFICIITLLPINMLWAKGLLAHRYLLPIYLILSFLGVAILYADYVNQRLRFVLTVLWVLIMITGNLWIYPPKISQGWDASLAHMPYYKLRQEANLFLDNNNINFEDVASFFPNTASLDVIDLNGDKRSFQRFSKVNKYVLYSNVYNLSDEEYDYIVKQYDVVKQFSKNGVFICLYSKK
ncbi:hypothetical protein [Aquimarina sp. 2201CG5-10]|uniref:hypothetical protein n=1 Tax=Aquimarina callyspongiae TaxID=3098150 RepID=UPI002AB5314D|nr:hypothetical protein [Aquimarina sp. 2201CG5-10]MDY8133989.1 hypothetical protein [Aquimarina sp. 2201CG5-10]